MANRPFGGQYFMTNPDHFPSISIAVFAHNEEASIGACLKSLLAAAGPVGAALTRVVVLANGCTDSTDQRVLDLAREDCRIQLCRISLGDKANAWNTYVHDLCSEEHEHCLHLFVDGDITCTPGTIEAVCAAVRRSPTAHAVSVLPAIGVGRNRALNVRLYEEDGAIFGNFYALTGEFLRDIRVRGIRIPRFSMGEDVIVGEMVCFSLDRRNPYDNRRAVLASPTEGFVYRSLSAWRWLDMRLYLGRRIRYRIRAWQTAFLRFCNFQDMPETMHPVNEAILSAISGSISVSPIRHLARKSLQRFAERHPVEQASSARIHRPNALEHRGERKGAVCQSEEISV
ncbi:MAG: glycosyltransferase family A protein [Planctomycetaceae bacterium]